EVDVMQGGTVSKPHFGFISASVGFEIDTSADETLMLMAGGKQVFSLPAGHSYDIEITKTAPLNISSHFHAYYDVLFTKVRPGDRFDFRATRDQHKPSPNPCLSEPTDNILPATAHPHETLVEKEGTAKGTPPFKCGGLAINAGGDPLS